MNIKRHNAVSILRIIATFMVVMVHFGQSLPLPSLLHKFVSYGAEGVTIFFIISGYVIAASLSRNSSTSVFYKKRIVRIVPIYFAVVTVNVIGALVLGTYPTDITHIGWLRYFLFVHAIVPTNDYFFWNNAAALWTMSSFMVFYLVAPGIHHLVYGRKDVCKRSLMICMGGVLLSLVSAAVYSQLTGVFEESGDYLASHSPFAVLFEFLVGMFIYYCCREKNGTIWIVLIGVLGSIFGINKFIVTALFGILLYSIMDMEVKCSERVGRILSKLDEYSFSIYLGHTTVMFILSRTQEIMSFGNVKLALFDLLGCIIFIPILHEVIEKPGAKAARKLLRLD